MKKLFIFSCILFCFPFASSQAVPSCSDKSHCSVSSSSTFTIQCHLDLTSLGLEKQREELVLREMYSLLQGHIQKKATELGATFIEKKEMIDPSFSFTVNGSAIEKSEVLSTIFEELENIKMHGLALWKKEDVKQIYTYLDESFTPQINALLSSLHYEMDPCSEEDAGIVSNALNKSKSERMISHGIRIVRGLFIGEDGLEYADEEIDDNEKEEEEVDSNTDPFLKLKLRPWERKNIYKIFSNMGEKSLTELFMMRRDLESRGNQINGVHPMRLAGYLLSDPYLKRCMGKIRHNSFKWDSFVKGYKGRMCEEDAKDELEKYAPGFAKMVGTDVNLVLDYIRAKNYEGLILALL